MQNEQQRTKKQAQHKKHIQNDKSEAPHNVPNTKWKQWKQISNHIFLFFISIDYPTFKLIFHFRFFDFTLSFWRNEQELLTNGFHRTCTKIGVQFKRMCFYYSNI